MRYAIIESITVARRNMALFSKLKKKQKITVPEKVTWLQKTDDQKAVTSFFFFGYAHMGSIRTAEFFESLKKYEQFLKRVTVHIPEYEFEKEENNTRAALQKYGLEETDVILDHELAFSAQLHNQWLPRIIITNKQGEIAYDHIGEGGHVEIEEAIQQEILKADQSVRLPEIPPETSIGGGLCYRTSQDMYLGYLHERYATKEEAGANQEEVYTQAERKVEEGELGLHGHWKIEKEYIEHTKTLPIASEHLTVQYSAFSVNIITEPLRSRIEIIVELDGRPIPEDLAGEDLTYNKEGHSIIKLDFPRAYRAIDADTYHRGQLKIRTKDADVRFYAILYGGCRNM